ncbi:DUF424 family protein [Nanoarchaeota archaeon]
MFIVKIHQGPHGQILVVSDKEIIDKKFEEGKLQLDLTKDFYKGKEMTEEEVKEKVKEFYILHLTGEKTIQLFEKLELVENEKVLVIKGVPHAEVYVAEN